MKKPPQRLSKILSERGICSRREADRYIAAGQVKVNGEILSELGVKVDENAEIELLGKAQKFQENKVTILLNKPIGYVSSQPEKGYLSAIELITPRNQYRRGGKQTLVNPSHLRKLSAAGRLDIDSKGLLILTQDGALVKKLIGEDSNIEKEYLVRVDGEINSTAIQKLSHGLRMNKKALKQAKVEEIEPGLLKIILTEGKKRQIRKMCELVKLRVVSLKSERIGDYVLGDIPEGKWRYI